MPKSRRAKTRNMIIGGIMAVGAAVGGLFAGSSYFPGWQEANVIKASYVYRGQLCSVRKPCCKTWNFGKTQCKKWTYCYTGCTKK